MTKLSLSSFPFYFIRHGETAWNAEHRVMGQQDIPLNETGMKQAYKAAPYLMGNGITRIVSSPLRRARQTAGVIAKELGITVEYHDGLKECCWGRIENTITERTPVQDYLEKNVTPVGGEPISTFQNRVVTTINELIESNERVLIVAHGGVYWALMNVIGHAHTQDSANAVPYCFLPAQDQWVIKRIDQE